MYKTTLGPSRILKEVHSEPGVYVAVRWGFGGFTFDVLEFWPSGWPAGLICGDRTTVFNNTSHCTSVNDLPGPATVNSVRRGQLNFGEDKGTLVSGVSSHRWSPPPPGSSSNGWGGMWTGLIRDSGNRVGGNKELTFGQSEFPWGYLNPFVPIGPFYIWTRDFSGPPGLADVPPPPLITNNQTYEWHHAGSGTVDNELQVLQIASVDCVRINAPPIGIHPSWYCETGLIYAQPKSYITIHTELTPYEKVKLQNAIDPEKENSPTYSFEHVADGYPRFANPPILPAFALFKASPVPE